MRIRTMVVAGGMATASLVLAAALSIDGVSAAASPPIGEPTPPPVDLPPPPDGMVPDGPVEDRTCTWSKLEYAEGEPPYELPPPVVVDCDSLPDLAPVNPPKPRIWLASSGGSGR